MTIPELLRLAASRAEVGVDQVQLVWPKGHGRFPLSGTGSQLLCVNHAGDSVYLVSVVRILQHVVKVLKEVPMGQLAPPMLPEQEQPGG